MESLFNFNDIFVFDLANNHQGSIEHGKNIINEVSKVANAQKIRGVFKFQFRQLDTFIHPSHKENSDNKHIPRFLSTRLSRADCQVLLDEVRKNGLLAACTPFDEESVGIIVDMGFDILKVASCSARDWPLLEEIADANLPVIFSTGGLSIAEIDDLVSFFDHRGVDYAIMHCVSIYPTPDERCQLNQIDQLIKRYPAITIGWSTHEDPNDTVPVQISFAKGARMFERHVGINTDTITLNGYSSTPEQVDGWISGYQKARVLCGDDSRPASTQLEIDAINGLKRGVYAKKAIKKGAIIERDQVYFSMPCNDGQLSSSEWKDGTIANAAINSDEALAGTAIQLPEVPEHSHLKNALHDIKALLNEARIPLNSDFEVEYSHHYGMARFREVGAVIINCINRSYCKKIIVQLPNQKHPAHFHKRKEETFQVLHGEVSVYIDGHERILRPGQTCLIQPGVWHSFSTKTGCIFEEVSTTHYDNDSVYKDKSISEMAREDRKTIVDHWGRFQTTHSDDIEENDA